MPSPITLPQPWRSLAYKVGGVRALAYRLRVSRQTIAGWASGEVMPRPAKQDELTTLFAHFALDIPNFDPPPVCPFCSATAADLSALSAHLTLCEAKKEFT